MVISFLFQTSLLGHSWIFTPWPSSTPSSFPTKGVGGWLCLGQVSLKGFVGTLYVVSPHRVLPGYQAVTVTVWLHLFETIATRTCTKLHLGVFHWNLFMVSYTGMNGKGTLIPNTTTLALPVQLYLWVVQNKSFGTVKAVCSFFFFILAWTRPNDWLSLSDFGLQSTDPFVWPHRVFTQALTRHSPQLRLLKLKQALLHKRLLCTKHATTAQHHMEEKNKLWVFLPSQFFIWKRSHLCKSWGWKANWLSVLTFAQANKEVGGL